MAAIKKIKKNGTPKWRARSTYIDPKTGRRKEVCRFRNTKAEAERAGREVDEIVSKRLGVYAVRGRGGKDPRTVKDLWDLCMDHWHGERLAPSTIGNKERAWKRFGPMIGHLRLSRLTEVVTDRLRQDLLNDGRWQWQTVRITVDEVRAMLKLASRWKIIDRIPDVPRITARRAGIMEEEKAYEKGLTKHEAVSLLGELEVLPNKTWHAMAWVQLLTGCRVGEVLGLRVENVKAAILEIEQSWSTDRREVGPTKARKRLRLPMTDELQEVLAPWITFRTEGFVFVNPTTGRPYTRVRYGEVLRAAGEDANITRRRVTSHTLRHTVGRLVGAETGNPIAVMRILGHTSLATSKGYIGGEEEQKKIATTAMSKLLGRRAKTN